jgi:hypothetical protein
MEQQSAKQERAEAIAQALSTSEARDEANEDLDMESFAQRIEAKVTQGGAERGGATSAFSPSD